MGEHDLGQKSAASKEGAASSAPTGSSVSSLAPPLLGAGGFWEEKYLLLPLFSEAFRLTFTLVLGTISVRVGSSAVEHLTFNERVLGSRPSRPISLSLTAFSCFLFCYFALLSLKVFVYLVYTVYVTETVHRDGEN